MQKNLVGPLPDIGLSGQSFQNNLDLEKPGFLFGGTKLDFHLLLDAEIKGGQPDLRVEPEAGFPAVGILGGSCR